MRLRLDLRGFICYNFTKVIYGDPFAADPCGRGEGRIIMKLVLQDLTKKFPSRNKKENSEVIAADRLNIEIPDGMLIGLLGPSGCGKSTALNLISGLLKPSAGKIFFGDDDVTDLPPENRGL